MEERPRVVRAEDRVRPEQQTAGMLREEAFATEKLWIGVVRAEPEHVSGWHHHGKWNTYAYVLSGTLRLESGPGGADLEEVRAGDFVLIPRNAIHREGSGGPGFEAITLRVGSGSTLFNVEGPEA
ncbi:MAG TPA: cupin domain-containing protein [Actinomycetota bacterium]|nr:cupin domain-containing protein [Actinomycetota bacterium]